MRVFPREKRGTERGERDLVGVRLGGHKLPQLVLAEHLEQQQGLTAQRLQCRLPGEGENGEWTEHWGGGCRTARTGATCEMTTVGVTFCIHF